MSGTQEPYSEAATLVGDMLERVQIEDAGSFLNATWTVFGTFKVTQSVPGRYRASSLSSGQGV